MIIGFVRGSQTADEFMLQRAKMQMYPEAPLQNIQNIVTWHNNHQNRAISEEEQSYLYRPLDLFSLVPKEKSPLRRLLERSPRFRIHHFWRHKRQPELPVYDKDVITYISDKRIEKFATAIIVIVGLVMIITPMWILQALGGRTVHKLGTITAFIVGFLGIVSYATAAKPFETLGATAA